jgi:hypothetical protein
MNYFSGIGCSSAGDELTGVGRSCGGLASQPSSTVVLGQLPRRTVCWSQSAAGPERTSAFDFPYSQSPAVSKSQQNYLSEETPLSHSLNALLFHRRGLQGRSAPRVAQTPLPRAPPLSGRTPAATPRRSAIAPRCKKARLLVTRRRTPRLRGHLVASGTACPDLRPHPRSRGKAPWVSSQVAGPGSRRAAPDAIPIVSGPITVPTLRERQSCHSCQGPPAVCGRHGEYSPSPRR